MKTFEEKWTAWLDGQLSGKELTDFEASLPDLAAAEAEKRDALRLGAFLKEQLAAQALSNEEFFSHQVREQIARDIPDRSRSRSTWWTVPRLVWCGATALALFVLTTVVLMNQHPAGEQSEYLTQILNSRVDPGANPNATISIFESKNDNKVTVLWTEGLQTLPADYAAK
ncbi:MAG: hypothetical protein QOE81_201 [Verrucomicrobiota bacterium]|jgi:hypothetical protein